MIRKRLLHIILFAIPIIVSILQIYVVYEAPLRIEHPITSQNLSIKNYSDTQINGNSSIESTTINQENIIEYTYTVGDKQSYPYAGIMLIKNDSSFINLSPFNACEVKIKATVGKQIPFYVFTNIYNESDWDNPNTFLNLQHLLYVTAEWSTISFHFDDMIVPTWWYRILNKDYNNTIARNFNETAIINIANCSFVPTNKSDTVSVKHITFYKSLSVHLWILCFISIVYYGLLYIFIYRKKQPNVIEQKETALSIIPHTPLDVENTIDKETEVILSTINTSYSNPQFSVTDIQIETGISERKIATIIKNKTGCNFKQYLNSVRITETKRLLQETDLSISEIAYKTGYNNVSHFNRVFKNRTSISPSAYRETHSRS